MFSQWAGSFPVPPFQQVSQKYPVSKYYVISMNFAVKLTSILLSWLFCLLLCNLYGFIHLILPVWYKLIISFLFCYTSINRKHWINWWPWWSTKHHENWWIARWFIYGTVFLFSFNVFSMLMIVRFIHSVCASPLGWYGVVFNDLMPQSWCNFANNELWNSRPDVMTNLRWKRICENVIVVQLLCSSFCRFGFGGKCLNISGEVIRHNKNIFKIFLALSNFKKSSDTISNGYVDFIGTNQARSSQFGCFSLTNGHFLLI